MISPTAAAGSLTPALMPGTFTHSPGNAPPPPAPPVLPTAPVAPGPDTRSPLDRAARLGSLPSSEVAKLVIRSKGAEYGLPQRYIDTAIRAQDLAVALEQDIDRMSNLLVEQMMSSGGGGAMDVLTALRAIDERSTQLVRLQEHLRDNFQLARRDPAMAQAQLESWIGLGAR